jgi:hypothetical protein
MNRINSVKLLIIGYALMHKDGYQSPAGLLLEPLHVISEELDLATRDEIREEFSSLLEADVIEIVTQEDKTAPARFRLKTSSQQLVDQLAPSQAGDPSLPFNKFVTALNTGVGKFRDELAPSRFKLLLQPPFTNTQGFGLLRSEGYPAAQGPSMAAPGRRGWAPNAYYPFVSPMGEAQPEGSEVETYANEAAQIPSTNLVERSTYIRGVKIEPADARLLAFKLARFLNAAQQMQGLEDNTFQIHVTFKGMEFSVMEAREVLETLQ